MTAPSSLDVPRRRGLALAALTLTVLLWSGNFVVGRALAGRIDPLTLNALRWSVACAAFLPFAGCSLWSARAALWHQRRIVLGLGLSGISVFHICVYSALEVTPVANAVLVLAATPFVILAGSALLGRARLGWRDGAAVGLSVAGVAVLLSGGSWQTLARLSFGAGDVWMLGAVAAWATYTLVLRAAPAELPRDALLAGSMLVGICVLVPLALALGQTDLGALPAEVWAGVGYVAVGASLVAYLCWSFGVGEVGPETAGFFINLMPVFGAGLAWLFLAEPLDATQALGAAGILGAIALRAMPRRA